MTSVLVGRWFLIESNVLVPIAIFWQWRLSATRRHVCQFYAKSDKFSFARISFWLS